MSGQYALSRSEIELVVSVLPKDRWATIDELHLAHSHPEQIEPFEYDAGRRIGYLIVPVAKKTVEDRSAAIGELLLGLARIRATSRFFHPLKPVERKDYQEFISDWLPRCEVALAPAPTVPSR